MVFPPKKIRHPPQQFDRQVIASASLSGSFVLPSLLPKTRTKWRLAVVLKPLPAIITCDPTGSRDEGEAAQKSAHI